MRLIAEAAADKKAEDILVLKLEGLTSLADFFIICSATTDVHVRAVVDHIEETLMKKGLKPERIEGYAVSEWVLMDYIDVIVHVFQPKTRQYYDLERLWIDAERIDIPKRGKITSQ